MFIENIWEVDYASLQGTRCFALINETKNIVL